MSDIQTTTWSPTAGSNNATPPNGFPEGMNPAQLNDSTREMMAALKRWYQKINPVITSGGAANVQTLTYAVAPASLIAGDRYCFVVGFANTGAATLNVNALGDAPIQSNGGSALTGGELIAGNTVEVYYDGTNFRIITPVLGVLRGFIGGLTLSNDGVAPNTVLDISAGQAADSANSTLIAIGAFTKSTAGAWAAGSASNGMGNGLTIANSTWYHVILANNGGTPDIYFDTSESGANRPAGISDTKVRRIGSFITDSSAHIVAFYQNGNDFLWGVQVHDVAVTNPGTSAALKTLSTPLGVRTRAIFAFDFTTVSAGAYVLVTSPDTTDNAPNANQFTLANREGSSEISGQLETWTNTSSQVRVRFSASDGNSIYAISTAGYMDPRGQNA